MLTYDILTVDNLTWVLALAFIVCILATVFDMSINIDRMGDSEKE